MTKQATAGLQAVRDIAIALGVDLLTEEATGNWNEDNGGTMPKIIYVWQESMVRYNNTDSYILIQIDQERPETFSMMEGTAPNYTYRWLHKINITLDVRSNKSQIRFEQILDNVMDILKNNVRLANYIQTEPAAIVYDNSVRNIWRATISFRIDKESPTV